MALHTTPRRPQLHHLPATPETVHWGYFDGTLTPKLTIYAGDIVELVTPTHWMVHAYHEDLNKAMYQAALELLDFLTTHKGLSAEDAYALMSVAADFTVTQVVDQRQGVHATLAKSVFVGR